jgi:hypothetical protein
MSEVTNFCQFCGAPLASGASNCEACGRAVKQVAAQAPSGATMFTPPPASTPPASTTPPAQLYTPPPAQPRRPVQQAAVRSSAGSRPPAQKKNSALPIVVGVIGCLVVLCTGVLVVGAIFFINNRNVSTISDIPQVIAPQDNGDNPADAGGDALVPTEIPIPTFAPLPTDAEQPADAAPQAPPASFDGNWSPDVGQELTDSTLSENFANNQFGWAEVDDETRSWSFQDQRYQVHLTETEYVVWAYLPVDFTPRGVEFDAALVPGFEQGAFGVLCHYQDENNYHYVALDVVNQEYAIGKYVDNEDTMLMSDWWMPAQHLQDSANAVNRVRVDCLPDKISLYINGQLETDVPIEQAAPGRTALYAETWEDMPPEGLMVQFDNLFAYQNER